jgi:hypothetical protein
MPDDVCMQMVERTDGAVGSTVWRLMEQHVASNPKVYQLGLRALTALAMDPHTGPVTANALPLDAAKRGASSRVVLQMKARVSVASD